VTEVRLEPWGAGDRELLDALLGEPAMTDHLGGPESAEKLADRQRRCGQDPRQSKILVDGHPAGWVGSPPGHPLRCNDWRLELRPA
jgi:hypothetical protein